MASTVHWLLKFFLIEDPNDCKQGCLQTQWCYVIKVVQKTSSEISGHIYLVQGLFPRGKVGGT
jgi:hypothetical protein